MKPKSVAIVGAAESTELGRMPGMSQMHIIADGALNAMADAGVGPREIDGIAAAGDSSTETVEEIADCLGIAPIWVDSTNVGGCSFMHHVAHAAAAINEGLCRTVLVAHGESGRSQIGTGTWGMHSSSMSGQFESPFGTVGTVTTFTMGVLRYMKETGLTREQLAMVSVVQREWAAKNPRAKFKDPISVDDVLNSRMIAYPFTKLMCCLVTDGGGALILSSAERAVDFPHKPVYVLGTGGGLDSTLASQQEDVTRSRAFRMAGQKAFAEARITPKDVDHLMIYDAFAHIPIFGLEDLGFVGRGEAGPFIAERNTAEGGVLPLNTNGGGLSYTHSGMYGMYALQESVRQLRGTAPAQVKDAKISVAHGVGGGTFASSGTVVLGNEAL